MQYDGPRARAAHAEEIAALEAERSAGDDEAYSEETPTRDLELRPDIDLAFAALDLKGQSSIMGLRAPRQIKKGLQKLPEFLPDETVLALTAGSDPPPGMSEQRSLGAAASLEKLSNVARSARLLVLTELNLWEVQATGRLNGSRPQGVQIPLGDIADVRTQTDRKFSRLGAKERYLVIDYMRGLKLETQVHMIPSDVSLNVFSMRLTEQVGHVSDAIDKTQARESARPTSVADELGKLAQLRDSGVLTEEEFQTQKLKLL